VIIKEGTLSTELKDLVMEDDWPMVTAEEEQLMTYIRRVLEKGSKEGHCQELKVQFAKDIRG
jgi:hypothetical protein